MADMRNVQLPSNLALGRSRAPILATIHAGRRRRHDLTARDEATKTSRTRLLYAAASSAAPAAAHRNLQDPEDILTSSTSSTGSSFYTLQNFPCRPTLSVLVVDIFAGSYSAGRVGALINSDPPSLSRVRVSAYAALEFKTGAYLKGPNHNALGIADESRFLSINGSITDPAVHAELLQFVQRVLQQSADGSGERIDGLIMFGGPPCTYYSGANNMQMQHTLYKDLDGYKANMYMADRMVISYLSLYRAFKVLCEGAPHPVTNTAVPTAVVMENPWSNEWFNIRDRTAAAAAHEEGPAGVQQEASQTKKQKSKAATGPILEKIPCGLRVRPFLQHELANNQGPLAISMQHWCAYGHLHHPMKRTAIFTDLQGLSKADCICKACGNKGKHPKQVNRQKNGDGGERATWPDAWVLRVIWLFAAQVSGTLGGNFSPGSSSGTQ